MNAKRIIFAACGTSWHSALVAEYIFEELARIPVEVEYASELRYRNPIIHADDVVIAISQSGETADTLAALELAKENKLSQTNSIHVLKDTDNNLFGIGKLLSSSEVMVVSNDVDIIV